VDEIHRFTRLLYTRFKLKILLATIPFGGILPSYGLNIKINGNQDSSKFRDPDVLSIASQELNRITNGNYQKVGDLRAIGSFMDVADNISTSFCYFLLQDWKKLLNKWKKKLQIHRLALSLTVSSVSADTIGMSDFLPSSR